jgi:hypothetical protein
MSKFKDKRGVCLTKLFDSIVDKQGEGWTEIYFAKPNQENKEFKKIVYVKYIPEFLKTFPNIMIFASVYHSEPVHNGKKIISILKMKKNGNHYSTDDEHLKIRFASSHWGAFRDMFVWATEKCTK